MGNLSKSKLVVIHSVCQSLQQIKLKSFQKQDLHLFFIECLYSRSDW